MQWAGIPLLKLLYQWPIGVLSPIGRTAFYCSSCSKLLMCDCDLHLSVNRVYDMRCCSLIYVQWMILLMLMLYVRCYMQFLNSDEVNCILNVLCTQ